MKSIQSILAPLLFASAALSRLQIDLASKVSPIETILSVSLTIPPPENDVVVYQPIADSPFILFSACELKFNSTNYNTPQNLAIRRTKFTPFGGQNVGSSIEKFTVGFVGPTPNYQYCNPQNQNVTLTWYPETATGKRVHCSGDPHCYPVIDDLAANRQINWDQAPIIYLQNQNSYYDILRSPQNDWAIIGRTAPWGSATVLNRICVRNGNYVVCINNNNTITHLNPSASTKSPINIQFANNEWQVMLPTGTTVEVINYGGHVEFNAIVNPSEQSNLLGFGNVTEIHNAVLSNNDFAKQQAFLAKNLVPSDIITYLGKPNSTEGLIFTNSTSSASIFQFSSCPEPGKQDGIWEYRKKCSQDTRVKRDGSFQALSFAQKPPSPAPVQTSRSSFAKREIVAITVPNPKVEFSVAFNICDKFVKEVPCAQIMNPTPFIEACTIDLQITGVLDFVESTIDGFIHICASRAESTGKDAAVQQANGFTDDFSCPSAAPGLPECSGHGVCGAHGCDCDDAYLGWDCSTLKSSINLI